MLRVKCFKIVFSSLTLSKFCVFIRVVVFVCFVFAMSNEMNLCSFTALVCSKLFLQLSLSMCIKHSKPYSIFSSSSGWQIFIERNRIIHLKLIKNILHPYETMRCDTCARRDDSCMSYKCKDI